MHFWLGSDADDTAKRIPAAEAPADRVVISQEASDHGERTVISLQGRLDFDRAAEVWQVLRESVGRYRCVLVDFSEVSQMDSAGLASLAEAHRLARQRGAIFALAGVDPQVMKMLKLSGLQRALRTYRTVAEALTSVANLASLADCPERSFSESLTGNAGPFQDENFRIDPLTPEPRRVA